MRMCENNLKKTLRSRIFSERDTYWLNKVRVVLVAVHVFTVTTFGAVMLRSCERPIEENAKPSAEPITPQSPRESNSRSNMGRKREPEADGAAD